MSFSRLYIRRQHLYYGGGMQVSMFRRVDGFFRQLEKKSEGLRSKSLALKEIEAFISG